MYKKIYKIIYKNNHILFTLFDIPVEKKNYLFIAKKIEYIDWIYSIFLFVCLKPIRSRVEA